MIREVLCTKVDETIITATLLVTVHE